MRCKKTCKEKSKIVSVIIPTYNCREFIKEAISSVFSQTYRDIEVIVNSEGKILEPKGINKEYPIFKKYNTAINKIFPPRNYLTMDSYFNGHKEKLTVYYGNIFKALFWENFIKTSSVIIREKIIRKVGNFNPILKTQEDYEYWLRMSK